MQLVFTFRHMEATAALKEYVEHKTQRLDKFLEKESQVQAILYTERHTQHIEFIIRPPGPTLTIETSANDMYAAIDLATDKAERLLVRRKEKLKDHTH